MQKKLVFGHKNPDTDTICSAIVYAGLLSKQGEFVEPVRLGEVNLETQFVLDYFGIEAPRLVQTVANETNEVILVDHNERQQSADDIHLVQVVQVIDHHRIANFETSNPLYYRAEPVGCTATILHKMFREKNVEIHKETAGLLCSAIISDTLLLKSPTTTEEDIYAAHELGKIAEIQLDEYGLQMLKAGADLSKKSVDEWLSLDCKGFSMGSYQVEIAQVNTVDVNDVLTRQTEVEQSIYQIIQEKKLDLFLFVVTDILNNDSVFIVLGNAAKQVEQAFGIKIVENKAFAKGVVSRKKQIVPPLTDTLSQTTV